MYIYVHVPVTAAAMRIIVVIMYMYIIGVEAQVTVIPPYDATITLGQIAKFSCSASNVASVTFVVAGIDPSMWAYHGINQSAPTFAGGYTTADLKVQGTIANDGLQISGRVYLVSGAYLDIPPPAQLNVQAPPSAPLNLTAAAVAGTYVDLTWSPPMDLGIGGPLYYNVSYQAVSGSSNVTSVITTDTHVNVTNLYPGVTYMMTVEADNGVSGDESKRSASINVTTNSFVPTYMYTPTQKPTVPSPAPSNAWMVGVGLGVSVMIVVMVVMVVLVAIVIRISKHQWKKSATTCIPLPVTEMASCDVVVVGMLPSSSQDEGSKSKPSSNANTQCTGANVESETCIKNNGAGHRNDGSTSVPTPEGDIDMRMILLPLCTEAADAEDSTTPQCHHGNEPSHTCTSDATNDELESLIKNNSSDGMKTPGFATSPLPATSTHMPSCDGVVVGMLTSSPQEEGSESKPSSGTNVASEKCISNNSHQTLLKHSSTKPSSAVHRNDGSTSVPTSEVCVGHDDMMTSPHPLSTEAIGITALMVSVGGGHIEFAEALLQRGADVNLKDNDGMTALMMASKEGHTKCVEALLQRGADVNIKDKLYPDTPADNGGCVSANSLSAPSKLFLDASIIIKVADYILLAILVVVAVVVVMTMIAVVLVTIVLMLALIHGRYEPEYRNHNGQEEEPHSEESTEVDFPVLIQEAGNISGSWSNVTITGTATTKYKQEQNIADGTILKRLIQSRKNYFLLDLADCRLQVPAV